MKFSAWGVSLLSLAAGVGIGYWLGCRATVSPKGSSLPAAEVRTEPRAVDGEAVLALKARIAGLEDSLSRSRRREHERQAGAEGATNAPPRPRKPWSQKVWLEDLRANNPKEYERVMAFRVQMRERLKDQESRMSSYYETLEIDAADSERLKNFEATIEVMQRLSELRALRYSDDDSQRPPPDEMHRVFSDARRLFEKERGYQLRELGQALGFDGADFEASVNLIFENTSIPSGIGGRGNRRSPPPPTR